MIEEETKAWDAASDEALANFEKSLDEEPAKQSAKKERKPKYAELTFEDETVVAAAGLGIHVIKGGKRCWVPDTWTQAALGIRMDYVVMLFPEQLLAIPEGPAVPSRIP